MPTKYGEVSEDRSWVPEESRFCIESLPAVKSRFFLRTLIIGKPRRTIRNDRKTELPCHEDDALCLVGPEGHALL